MSKFNSSDLNEILGDLILDLKAGRESTKKAEQINKAAGNLIANARTELAQAIARGDLPDVEFLRKHDTAVMPALGKVNGAEKPALN